MVEVGQKVRFDPFRCISGYGTEECRHKVTGKVVMVNEAHHWFSVEYGKTKQRYSFLFADIGEVVKIIG